MAPQPGRWLKLRILRKLRTIKPRCYAKHWWDILGMDAYDDLCLPMKALTYLAVVHDDPRSTF